MGNKTKEKKQGKNTGKKKGVMRDWQKIQVDWDGHKHNVFFVSLASHLFVFPLCFFPVFFPLFYFPLFFFTVFFLVLLTHPHTLSPQSALPHPLPSLFIQGLVLFVLCICLKIGLGRETFSCNRKSVRLILWKALQSSRALFRLEDYYILRNIKERAPVMRRMRNELAASPVIFSGPKV